MVDRAPRGRVPLRARVWSAIAGVGWIIVQGSDSVVLLILLFLLWLGVSALIIGAAGTGRLPGARTPYAGSACRVCHRDLTSLLPGDGHAVRCPGCGYRNVLGIPACGSCGYILQGVPADERGVRRCPECGYERDVLVAGRVPSDQGG